VVGPISERTLDIGRLELSSLAKRVFCAMVRWKESETNGSARRWKINGFCGETMLLLATGAFSVILTRGIFLAFHTTKCWLLSRFISSKDLS
jgi:hypothetical protein